MKRIASMAYDPATMNSLALTSTTSFVSMRSQDGNVPQLTFTPANSTVFVRGRANWNANAGVYPRVLLGVMESSTTMLRMQPVGGTWVGSATNQRSGFEYAGYVTGLSIASHTWDPAYAVQVATAGTSLAYGGPNDATGNDGFGMLSCEVYDVGSEFLAVAISDPTTAVVKATTATAAMAKIDASTSLSATFTAPASGNVWWRLHTVYSGSSGTLPGLLLGIMESTTVVARQNPVITVGQSSLASSGWVLEASGVVTGVSAGSHTWDAAFSVQDASSASGALKYGGPNNASGANAWGASFLEILAAA